MKPHAAPAALVLVAAAVPPLYVLARGHSPAGRLVMLAGVAAISAGLILAERWLRRAGFTAVSLPATILLLYGTPLVWYETVEPGLAAMAFLAGTVLVRAWWPRRGHGCGTALARGGALGLVLIGVALLADALGGAHVGLGPPMLLDTLFSSRHGLFFWTPVLTLGTLGLLGHAVRGHAGAVGALGALALMAIVNAALRPWWSGGMVNARFLPALPLFAFGLAAVLDVSREAARRRPVRVLAAAGMLLVAWNLLLMAQYRAETIPRDDTVSFPAVAENSARMVTAVVGAPVAWPANWVFAARHRLPVARYDLLAGQDVLAAGPAHVDVGNLDVDAAVLGEGWSVRHPCGSSVCREVEGRARLLLPIADAEAVLVRVRAQGSGTLRVTVNGGEIARATLEDAFTDVGGPVARPELRRGPNEVVLEVSPEGRALVDAVTIAPLEGAR